MSFSSTAAVVASMAARIEALDPPSQVSADDRFRCQCRPAVDSTGSRAVHLLGSGGIRKVGANRHCETWQTRIEVVAYYVDQPTEPGADTVHQVAIADAEAILADLYTWASEKDGINRIAPQLAEVQADGQGEIIVSRFLDVEFERG